jgi:predicted Zn-dependent peptidase
MNLEYKILDNGLTIINDKMNFDSSSIGVWIGSGSSNEKKNQSGIAHMLEHMAFKGTVNRSAQ